ncbi:MarC family protein [Fulvimarina sp. MAC3]|uniref:MarC family protein n=1 Tax=Fulvimarina sp. MAC3 TaxID=3148887 RepID=UPI0031FD9116
MSEADLMKALGAFFAIMNPFMTLPLFLALTSEASVAEQRAVAVKVGIYSTAMCAVILIAGSSIIHFFGITIDQFRVAGGAVLAKIAFSMLNGQTATAHHGSSQERATMADLPSLAFYPITFPMIVGPGTIATIILYAGRSTDAYQLTVVAIIVAAMLLFIFIVLFFSAQIGRIMSETMRVITTRLMGMILLAISVEMIVAGLLVLLPGLASR